LADRLGIFAIPDALAYRAALTHKAGPQEIVERVEGNGPATGVGRAEDLERVGGLLGRGHEGTHRARSFRVKSPDRSEC
jgi:hypothetical protein